MAEKKTDDGEGQAEVNRLDMAAEWKLMQFLACQRDFIIKERMGYGELIEFVKKELEMTVTYANLYPRLKVVGFELNPKPASREGRATSGNDKRKRRFEALEAAVAEIRAGMVTLEELATKPDRDLAEVTRHQKTLGATQLNTGAALGEVIRRLLAVERKLGISGPDIKIFPPSDGK